MLYQTTTRRSSSLKGKPHSLLYVEPILYFAFALVPQYDPHSPNMRRSIAACLGQHTCTIENILPRTSVICTYTHIETMCYIWPHSSLVYTHSQSHPYVTSEDNNKIYLFALVWSGTYTLIFLNLPLVFVTSTNVQDQRLNYMIFTCNRPRCDFT